MAESTTYTCDRCKEKSQDGGFLRVVRLQVKDKYYRGYSDNFDVKLEQEWCEKCIAQIDLREALDEHKREPPPQPTPIPTFEELVRNIVEEALAERQGG